MKNCLLAVFLFLTASCYGQPAKDDCLKALPVKGLNKFSGKNFELKTENELPCVGDCICRCRYTAQDGSAGLRISNDAGRKEYKMLLGMATNAKAVAAGDWLYAFYHINNSDTGKPQMSVTLHKNGKTYVTYVTVYRTEEESKGFLIEVLLRATGAQ